MLGYNQAAKVTMVPFPFPFTQMVSLLVVVFVIVSPIVIAQWTGGVYLCSFMSFFVNLGFWGLNEICGELENPFGDDPNDLPLVEIHHEFIEALAETICLRPPRDFHDLVGVVVDPKDSLFSFARPAESAAPLPPVVTPVPDPRPAPAAAGKVSRASQTSLRSVFHSRASASTRKSFATTEDPFSTSA